MKFASDVPKEGTTRKLLVDMQSRTATNQIPIVEGVIPFNISGEGMCRLEIGIPGKNFVLYERSVKRFQKPVIVTLRLSQQTNRYSAKVQCGNEVLQTGWREANAEAYAGNGTLGYADVLFTDVNEFWWTKRAALEPDEDGVSWRVFVEP